jgi:aspartyl-tRNA(Asn)/glutamyl-tRNA(Gln) amidotransferase subunit A
MTDPTSWSLVEAAEAIGSGRISSVELTAACIARAKAWQPVTNAFIDLREDAALAAARAADQAPAPRGRLHGVPLAHKDMYYREGRISTCGSVIRRDWVAPATASVLVRLDQAGAIDLGTLNMAEWAGGATGHNIHFGDACNPFSPAHITGGSSSGTGAAVAARAIFAGLGSDTGGSIRLPAAACGIAGIKPTNGRVSRAGCMPRAWSLDCVGPLARTVRDCARLLGVIAGPDEADPTAAFETVPDYELGIDSPVAGMTLGVPENFFPDEVDGPVQALLDAALGEFHRLGVKTVAVRIPDGQALLDLGGLVSVVEAAAIHRALMTTRPQDYSRNLFERTEPGFHIPAVRYLEALSLRAHQLDAFVQATLAHCDALFVPAIGPVLPTRAATDTEAGVPLAFAHTRLIRCTRPFNYLGLPVLSVPCGFTPGGEAGGGLPAGFQLAGRPFDEITLFRLGHAFQQATDHHLKAPALPETAAA